MKVGQSVKLTHDDQDRIRETINTLKAKEMRGVNKKALQVAALHTRQSNAQKVNIPKPSRTKTPKSKLFAFIQGVYKKIK